MNALEAARSDSPALPRDRRIGAGAILVAALIGLTLFLGTAAGVLIIESSGEASAAISLIIWLNISVMVGCLSIEIARRPYSLHTMHLLSLFLFLGAPAILQYSLGTFAVAGPITQFEEELPIAVTAVLLWLVGYITAYEVRYRLAGRIARGPIDRFLGREVTYRRVFWMVAASILVLVYLGVVIGLSGVSSRGSAYETQAVFAAQYGGALGGGLVFYMINQYLFRAFPIIAVVAALLVMRRRPISRQPVLIGLLLVALAGIYLADNPFAASRMWLVTCLIAGIAPMVLARMRTAWVIVVASISGLTILPALSANRNATDFSDWLGWLSWIGLASPLDFLARGTDADSLGMLVICVTYTIRNGYQWGLQIASGLFSWVPRSLWPGKGVGTGHMVSDSLGFEFTNLAPPIISEPIVDFGLIGVLPFAVAIGWLFSKLDQVYWSAGHTKHVPVRVIDVILPFWLGLVVIVTRGDFIAANTFILGFTLWILPMGLGARLPAARVASEEGGGEAAGTVTWGEGSLPAAPPGART